MASLNNNHDIKVSSSKRDEPEEKSEHESKNEQLNTNKKARLSVTNVLEPLASFDTLDDDCLSTVLEFVGNDCYIAFGLVDKRCHEMFCSKGYPKKTSLYGYGPLHLIQQRRRSWGHSTYCIYGVLEYNRMDILEWMMRDDPGNYYYDLKSFCIEVIQIDEARLDILRLVFERANMHQMEYLRNLDDELCICSEAANYGNLECMKFLRQNGCEWDKGTWIDARDGGHEHILQYMRDNGYPFERQDESESDSDSDSDSE